jgi:hypothetical protein
VWKLGKEDIYAAILQIIIIVSAIILGNIFSNNYNILFLKTDERVDINKLFYNITSRMPRIHVNSIILDRVDDRHIMISVNVTSDKLENTTLTIHLVEGDIIDMRFNRIVGHMVLLDTPIDFNENITSRLIYLLISGDKASLDDIQFGRSSNLNLRLKVSISINQYGIEIISEIPMRIETYE